MNEQEIHHLLYDIPENVDYTDIPQELDLEDVSKERVDKLSNSRRKKLMQSGQILENGHIIVNSYLIGQLGENYNL